VKLPRITLNRIVTVLAVLVLAAALPSAIRDTIETGRVYLFSWQFWEELPRRFSGPGRFRFVLEPLIAIFLGGRDGLADAKAGRPPYLYGLLLSGGGGNRRELIRQGWTAIRNLVAVGIVLDSAAQLLIYRLVHPGAALVVGPVLIGLPYGISRGLTNRLVRRKRNRSGP
jgi:hypothetical protein